MEQREYLERKRARRQKKRKNDSIWNFLTFLAVLGIVGAGIFSLAIFSNPQIFFNPFPPPTSPTTVMIVSSTSRPVHSTPTIGFVKVSDTPSPTGTASPVPDTATPTPFTPTETLEGSDLSLTPMTTPDENADYKFAAQSDPEGIKASLFNPNHTCNWMGVGGQVFDLQGRPVANILVKLEGYLDRHKVDVTSLTGTAIQYGSAGYEFTITETPTATKHTLWVRLVDQSNAPLSPRIYFDTYQDCNKNLIVVNFKQVR